MLKPYMPQFKGNSRESVSFFVLVSFLYQRKESRVASPSAGAGGVILDPRGNIEISLFGV
jgi:hypothetical protein